MNTQVSPAKVQEPSTAKPRLQYIDNIRWLMIVLVVLIHINVTYSGIGGWYYVEQDVNKLDTISKVVAAIFGMFTQAYFMGFLFFIAGYFVPGAYDRKGAATFIKDRLIRLGLPVLFYVLIINPFISYFLLGIYKDGANWSLKAFYSHYFNSLEFISGTGPLWFALALLIFSAFYAIIRLSGIKPFKFKKPLTLSGSTIVFTVIMLISFFTFIVRLYSPFGTDFFNMQFCFFTQYIVFFTLGIIAYRNNLLMKISYKFGIKWFKISLIFGFILWVVMILVGGALEGNENLYFGGFYWQSAAYSLWEQIFCAGMCLGLIVIFRDRFNKHSKVSSFLSDNAFGVYVFHAPILIFISLTFRNIYLYPFIKEVMIAAITLPTCFIFSHLIRKLPVLGKVFS